MSIKYVNNSESTLAAGIGAGDTTLTVAAGHGVKFPTIVADSGDYFYATLVTIGGQREVIKVTEHQVGTDVFQVIVRAADAISNGTATAYAFSAADRVQCRLPAAAIMAPDGTANVDFHIDNDGTGPRIKNNSGVLEIRNATDNAYANLRANNLTLESALAMVGTITGATSITMNGNLTGAVGGAFSGAVSIGGAITAPVASNIEIDNEADGRKIKARDHGTATTPEVVNVIYGTGAAPAASGVPIGTLFIKYVA